MSTTAVAPANNLRSQLAHWLEAPWFSRSVIALIVLNAIILGMEAIPSLLAKHAALLHRIDHTLLLIFTAELILKIFAFGPRKCFSDPWNVFDFIIIGIAYIPAGESFAVLRALRILRALRLISQIESMRKVVTALLGALPGMGAIVALLTLVIYVAAVMATKLFAHAAPEMFGDLGKSLFTLFQIMTVEGWPDIARQVMAEVPYAWIFFVIYLVCATFTVLNLFIAVIVNAMQSQFEEKKDEQAQTADAHSKAFELQLMEEIKQLRADVQQLRAAQKA